MTRMRLTLGDDGLLRRRDQRVVARVVSMVLEFDPETDAAFPGDEPLGGLQGVKDNSQTALAVSSSDVVEISDAVGGAGGSLNGKIGRVWAHYQHVIPGASRQKLDSTKRTIISNALKVRSVEECCEAIDGLAASPHHNGQNDRREKYLGIRYALKGNQRDGESNEERIDKMRRKAAERGTADGLLAQLPSAQRGMVRERQRHVEALLTTPGETMSQSVSEAGRLAQAYLKEHLGLQAYLDDAGHVQWVRATGVPA